MRKGGGIERKVVNFYSRASHIRKILKNRVAMEILFELYPSNKYEPEKLADELNLDRTEIQDAFKILKESNMIADNPNSGRIVLTDEGKFFLEQTATAIPELKEYLNKARREASPKL